jgi:RNA polymerase sigma factor (sigma-70 family)
VADDIVMLGGPERRSRSDTDESVEPLFHAYYPQIVYTAFSLVGDWDLAEQLAQDAYLRLLHRWRWIADRQAATPYLQRTVVNLSRENIRRKMIERRALKTRDTGQAEAPRPEAPQPEAPQPEAPQPAIAPVVELRRAIAGMPARKRECVVLRYLLQLSEAETASLLGISVGTVKSQTHEGFRHLRDRLDEVHADHQGDEAVGMTDTGLEQRLRDLRLANLSQASGRRALDTRSAWRDFQQLRSRSTAFRRRISATTAVIALAGVAIAVPALAGNNISGRTPPGTGASASAPSSPTTYPRAIVARFELSGVVSVVGNPVRAWAVRATGPLGIAATYQFVGLDLRKNTILYRVNLGRQIPAIAAGAGRVWLTTSYSQAGGQIVRVNPATGQILSMIHIPAGPCTAISFSSAHLFASCNVGGTRRNAIWRINPVTQQVFRLTRTLHGHISSLTAAPRGLWYVVDFSRIAGLTNTGGNPQPVTALDPGYLNPPPGGQGLVYDSGSIWALRGGERLIQIDALNGRVMQVFTYRNYDPSRAGGLDFLAAGGGWLWFLDNGYPFSGVLRVGETTARPAGGVAIPPNSCGQQVCSQIFYTPGSVWVPIAELLLRIDTSRLPS